MRDDPAQLHEEGPRRVAASCAIAGERFTARARRRSPALGRREIASVHHQAPAPLAAAAPRALLLSVTAVTDRPGARHLPALASGCASSRRRRGGIILLNGKRLHLRGASVHEDDVAGGRRAHPGHPDPAPQPAAEPRRHGHPLALPAPPRVHRGARPRRDPVLGRGAGLPAAELVLEPLRRPQARPLRAAPLTVRNNLNHPSIFTWSLVDEPAEARAEPRHATAPDVVRYIREASEAVRELDDTRLVGLDRQSRVGEPLHPAHRYLDVLGVNEYFGWYRSVGARTCPTSRPPRPPSSAATSTPCTPRTRTSRW